MYLKRTVAPTEFPVTTDQVKNFLRVDGNEDDDLIDLYIEACTDTVERYLNRNLITQTWEQTFDRFPTIRCAQLELGKGPVIAITSIVISNVTGSPATEVWASSNYQLTEQDQYAKVVLAQNQEWPTNDLPSVNGVKATYTTGYGSAANVPGSIKLGLLHLVGYCYENREVPETIPPQICVHLRNNRIWKM